MSETVEFEANQSLTWLIALTSALQIAGALCAVHKSQSVEQGSWLTLRDFFLSFSALTTFLLTGTSLFIKSKDPYFSHGSHTICVFSVVTIWVFCWFFYGANIVSGQVICLNLHETR